MANLEHAQEAVWRERRFGDETTRRPFSGASDDRAFQRDRARVIHSAAFRRLQGKTQILSIGEGDFYRTRLTHSLEVAQIASGICEHLKESCFDNAEILEWIPSMNLIEAISLAHDIGHPPFGHGGEIALNYYMRNFGGFEGNGQTLRIVSRLGEYTPAQGLDLTRRAMLGLLKYPALHRDLADYSGIPSDGSKSTLNIDAWRPPKCVLDDDEEALYWISAPLSDADRKLFHAVVKEEPGRHGRTCHESFDASIMEPADDIAYGVHDFEDALALRLVSFREWEDAVAEAAAKLGAGELHGNIDFYNKKLFSESDKDRKHAVSRLVHYFISNISIQASGPFESPLLRYRAKLEAPAAQELELLKTFVFKHVIRSPNVQVMEFKGQQMLLKLFEVLFENPTRLLPKPHNRAYRESANPPRVIADYLSQMSDTSATKLYLNLFSPNMAGLFNPFWG